MNFIGEVLGLFWALIEALFSLIITIISGILGPLFLGVVLFIFWIPLALFQGYILYNLWDWFIVPVGFHSITLLQAIGISLIATLLQSPCNNFDTKDEVINQAKYWFLGQILVLSIGYIVKTCFVLVQ